ncbi:MAG: hypothetical protein IKJ73_08825 [Lachnospiraceae bacterium]|nr:hypothetical protein [Lachnospiraceae bacterium]
MSKGRKKNKNKKKISNRQVEEKSVLSVSIEEFASIQEEAYYNALKKLELDRKNEKTQEVKKESELEKQTLKDKIRFIFYMLVLPGKAQENLGLDVRVYDILLSIFVSGVFKLIGHVIRIISIVLTIALSIDAFNKDVNLFVIINVILVGIVLMLMGSLFILAGDEFEKQDDKNCLYAYSASFIALITLIVSVIGMTCD